MPVVLFFVMKVLLALDPRLTERRGVRIDAYHPEHELRELGCTVCRVTSLEAFLRALQQECHTTSPFDVALTDGMLTDKDQFGIAVGYYERCFLQSPVRGLGVCVPRHLRRVMPPQTRIVSGHCVLYSDDCFTNTGEPHWTRLLTRVCYQLRSR